MPFARGSPSENMKTIYSNENKATAEKLKLARQEVGLTQLEVASLLNKSQSFVSKIESSQLRIDLHLLSTFSRIYRKDIVSFLQTNSRKSKKGKAEA